MYLTGQVTEYLTDWLPCMILHQHQNFHMEIILCHLNPHWIWGSHNDADEKASHVWDPAQWTGTWEHFGRASCLHAVWSTVKINHRHVTCDKNDFYESYVIVYCMQSFIKLIPLTRSFQKGRYENTQKAVLRFINQPVNCNSKPHEGSTE